MSSTTEEVLHGFKKVKPKQSKKEGSYSIKVAPLEQKLTSEAKALIDINTKAEAKELTEAQIIKKVDEYIQLMNKKGGCIQYNKELNAYKAISLCNAYLLLSNSKAVFNCLQKIHQALHPPHPPEKVNERCCTIL